MQGKLNVRMSDLTLGETAMRKFVILAFLTAPAAPALAGTWTAPEGCEVFMTVQSKGCLLYTSRCV